VIELGLYPEASPLRERARSPVRSDSAEVAAVADYASV